MMPTLHFRLLSPRYQPTLYAGIGNMATCYTEHAVTSARGWPITREPFLAVQLGNLLVPGWGVAGGALWHSKQK